MYKIDLQELKNNYDFGKIDAYTAAQILRGIIRRNEAFFLKIGFISEENRPQDNADSTTALNNPVTISTPTQDNPQVGDVVTDKSADQ